MTKEEVRLKAEENFKSGYNCAQAVVKVFADEAGIDSDTLVRLAQGFGGGMSRQREVCGAVSGMVMIASLLCGSSDPADKSAKDNCYDKIQALCQKFREQNGSIICRELLGLVPMGQSEAALKNKTPVEHKVESSVSSERTTEYYKKRPCALLCADAAELLADFLSQK